MDTVADFFGELSEYNRGYSRRSVAIAKTEERGVHKDSQFAIACKRYGLDYRTTSFVTLASRKHGSETDLSLAELEKLYGENWTNWACK